MTLIDLRAVMRPAAVQTTAAKARHAWPGGAVVSNKGAARVKLAERLVARQASGAALSREQEQLVAAYREGVLAAEARCDTLRRSPRAKGRGAAIAGRPALAGRESTMRPGKANVASAAAVRGVKQGKRGGRGRGRGRA
jgi:hypothetical protein